MDSLPGYVWSRPCRYACLRLFACALALLWGAGLPPVQAQSAPPAGPCGVVVQVPTHDHSTSSYSLVPPADGPGQAQPITLLLLAGGSGLVDLDGQGCARALAGNFLVRSIAAFNAAGFGTALLDAPSDLRGPDGLGGFRTAVQHAQDLGQVIADLRTRTHGAVWVVGSSRGSISAANAASRLPERAAPDGVVLVSVLTAGQPGAKKAWAAQTVFDLPLHTMHVPTLLVGHADDKCIRSPPQAMEKVAALLPAQRQQVVTVRGGPGYAGFPGLQACQGHAPHGFVDQEAQVVAGMARFVRGASY